MAARHVEFCMKIQILHRTQFCVNNYKQGDGTYWKMLTVLFEIRHKTMSVNHIITVLAHLPIQTEAFKGK